MKVTEPDGMQTKEMTVLNNGPSVSFRREEA